jgi:hypothetical protein
LVRLAASWEKVNGRRDTGSRPRLRFEQRIAVKVNKPDYAARARKRYLAPRS